MKVSEAIANMIRETDLTDGEIDYLIALLNDKKHLWEVAKRDKIIERFRKDEADAVRARIEKRQRDEFPASHNLIDEVLKNH